MAKKKNGLVRKSRQNQPERPSGQPSILSRPVLKLLGLVLTCATSVANSVLSHENPIVKINNAPLQQSNDPSDPKNRDARPFFPPEPPSGVGPKVRYIIRSENEEMDVVLDLDESLFQNLLSVGIDRKSKPKSLKNKVCFSLRFAREVTPVDFCLDRKEWEKFFLSSLDQSKIDKNEIAPLLQAKSIYMEWLEKPVPGLGQPVITKGFLGPPGGWGKPR